MLSTALSASSAAVSPGRRACIFLEKPFADCYCMNLASCNVRKMVDFCIGDFGSCEVYRRHADSGQAGAAPQRPEHPAIPPHKE